MSVHSIKRCTDGPQHAKLWHERVIRLSQFTGKSLDAEVRCSLCKMVLRKAKKGGA